MHFALLYSGFVWTNIKALYIQKQTRPYIFPMLRLRFFFFFFFFFFLQETRLSEDFIWPNVFYVKCHVITKTYLYNFDPLKLLYIKTGVYRGIHYFFLFLLKNMDCGYSSEPPRRGGSNEYPQSMFWVEMWKIWEFLSEKNFSFWWWNFQYIWIGVFS